VLAAAAAAAAQCTPDKGYDISIDIKNRQALCSRCTAPAQTQSDHTFKAQPHGVVRLLLQGSEIVCYWYTETPIRDPRVTYTAGCTGVLVGCTDIPCTDKARAVLIVPLQGPRVTNVGH
jgi:hypothetical protein